MNRFDANVLSVNREQRRVMLNVLVAALAAVDPTAAVRTSMHLHDSTLIVDERHYDLMSYARIFVVGAGKAGAAMAQAVESLLGDRISAGLVVVKTGHGGETEWVEIVEATHPVPNATGVQAGGRMLALAEGAGPDDLVIALISGGGSALLVAPAPGLTLADLQRMTDLLLASGATINEINCLRKHCSAIKGGQLARAAAPATLISLILSDVVGSPLDVIASGPTVADNTTWADAWAVVARYALADRLPTTVVARLQAGLAGELSDTPGPDDPAFARAQTAIVADNRTAALAALKAARTYGYNTLLLSTFIEGEARQVAELAVALGREVQASNHPVPAPACLIMGGETTVTLGGSPGMGGRNQELALAAALALDSMDGITVISLATDGTDGPTDSAGAIADGGTVARGRALGLNAADFLRRHDAYPYSRATNDLLLTGPTRTNVNDLIFVFVDG